MDENPIIISAEKCHNVFKELELGYELQKNQTRSSIEQIQDILKECRVLVHPKPLDDNGSSIWTSESRRLISAFSRMKQSRASKKFRGNFFDSRKFKYFASPMPKSKSDTNNNSSKKVRSLIVNFL